MYQGRSAGLGRVLSGPQTSPARGRQLGSRHADWRRPVSCSDLLGSHRVAFASVPEEGGQAQQYADRCDTPDEGAHQGDTCGIEG